MKQKYCQSYNISIFNDEFIKELACTVGFGLLAPLVCTCTFLEQQRYQIEDKPSHAVGVLNKTNETKIVMHHADHLTSNASDETGRIDSALVSRKVAFSILQRRYGVQFLDWGIFVQYIHTLPVQLAARILDKLFTDIMLLPATDLVTACSPAHGRVQIRLSDICLHYP